MHSGYVKKPEYSLGLKESELKFCITNFVCSHYIRVAENYVFLHKF